MSTGSQVKIKTDPQTVSHGSFVSYSIGFIASIGLTLIAFYLVTSGMLRGGALIAALAVLAVIQLVVQLVFFLHLSFRARTRSQLFVLWFMVLTVVIIVAGSLWIMNNLKYNMMSPADMLKYMNDNQGF